MSKVLVTSLLLGLAITLACAPAGNQGASDVSAPQPSLSPEIEQRCLLLSILDRATVVETYRLRSLEHTDLGRLKDERYVSEFFAGMWPIARRGPDKRPYFARWLREFVADERNFRDTHNGIKGCLFEPNVGFLVRAEGTTVSLAICFGCGDVDIVASQGSPELIRHDFTPGYGQLLAYALDAFPEDEYLAKQADRLSGKAGPN